MLVGNTYPFKEFLKERFETICYKDLIFNNGTSTKAAWVLPAESQTAATGTLANFLRELGVIVSQEIDLDNDDDDEDDDDDGDSEGEDLST